ncbi:MAG: hypothetical protein LBO81_05605 [Clostridiales Family XIII bacterium]|jgi:uncharacterized membrane protein YkvI|nr:hypothetical protein [Clostridiales Family XIII bacterium]
MKEKLSVKRLITIAGTYLAFAIGSGFATGQEILQYFAVYGAGAFAASILLLIVGSLMDGEFIATGQREQFERKDGVYRYYAGKYIGTFYDYFTNLFVYMSFVVMCSGAGAALEQQYGLPAWIGVVLLAVLSGLTVTLGLNRIAGIIGKIGPALIVAVIVISIINIGVGKHSIAEGMRLLPELDVLKAAPNWALSAFNYLGFGILWMVAFLPAYGKTLRSPKEAAVGQTLGVVLFSITSLIVVLAMFANAQQMEGAQIPIMYFAENIHPIFGSLYTILIFLAIYSSAVPLLYGPATRFVDEKSAKGKIIIVVLAVIGAVIAMLLPFNVLMNYIYVINGYVGIIFVVFVAVRVVIRIVNNRKKKAA